MSNAAQYEVLFDLAGSAYEPPASVIVWAAVLSAISLASLVSASGRWRLAPALAVFAVVAFAAMTISVHHRDYTKMRSAVEGGNAAVVEGMVRDFRPDAATGNGFESFAVATQRFVIRHHEITPAFRQTVGVGGPDLTNKCVRVRFVHDQGVVRIVWLGIKRDGCS